MLYCLPFLKFYQSVYSFTKIIIKRSNNKSHSLLLAFFHGWFWLVKQLGLGMCKDKFQGKYWLDNILNHIWSHLSMLMMLLKSFFLNSNERFIIQQLFLLENNNNNLVNGKEPIFFNRNWFQIHMGLWMCEVDWMFFLATYMTPFATFQRPAVIAAQLGNIL